MENEYQHRCAACGCPIEENCGGVCSRACEEYMFETFIIGQPEAKEYEWLYPVVFELKKKNDE